MTGLIVAGRRALTTSGTPRSLGLRQRQLGRRQEVSPMLDVITADKELATYIRPQTFPVAIRMLKPGEPIPPRARRPARDFKKLSMSCQVIDMARRHGWTIAFCRD